MPCVTCTMPPMAVIHHHGERGQEHGHLGGEGAVITLYPLAEF